MEKELAETYSGLQDDKIEDCMITMDLEHSTDEDDKNIIVPHKGDLVASQDSSDLEPCEGMEFESEEAAKVFYSAYARSVGFRIRISKYSRSRRDNSVISRRLVCSKEGFREARMGKGLFGEQRQRQRAVTRVGCKAMVMVKKIANGKWVVTKFVKEHNHGPVPPRIVEASMAHEDYVPVGITPVYEGETVEEPYEGLEFESEEAAKAFYNIYATQMGFRARISKYCRSRRDNSIISRQIVCSKEGFREIRVKKENGDEGKIKRPRVVTRIGCKAMILVKKLSSGKWVVARFEKEHNHALLETKKVLQLHSSMGIDRGSHMQGPQEPANRVVLSGCSSDKQGTSRESLTVLYNQLCCEAIKYAQEGAVSEDIYNVAMSALQEAVEKVAAAKRKVVTVAQAGRSVSGANKEVTIGNFMTKANEPALLERPVNFVLIPSTMPSDANPTKAPLILNIPHDQVFHNQLEAMNSICSGQRVNGINHVSIPYQQLPSTPCGEGLVGNGSIETVSPLGRKRELETENGDMGHSETIKKSQKLDAVGAVQPKSRPSDENNLDRPVLSDSQLVAIPALPIALYMPVMGNLSTTSVSTQGTPGSSYALVAAPIEALPVSAFAADASAPSHAVPQPTGSFQGGMLALTPSARYSSDINKPYTGPNSQLHAAAIAAGARILPPKAAASLIKAVESRIKSAGASLAISTFTEDSKPVFGKSPQPWPCNSESQGDSCKQEAIGEMKLQNSAALLKESEAVNSLSVLKNDEENHTLVDRQVDLLDTMGDAEDMTMFEVDGFSQ